MTRAISVAIFLVFLSLATAVDFTTVYEWPEVMAYYWPPSEAVRKEALVHRSFKPDEIQPNYMAVYGHRIFLSLYNSKDTHLPASLVYLPTSSANLGTSPKLSAYPSWIHHRMGDCRSTIHAARGLEVDSVGRLWVHDSGTFDCPPKLLIFNLANDHRELEHTYPFDFQIRDMVVDETPHGFFAYMTPYYHDSHMFVFSLKSKQSWKVDTPRVEGFSIALSPKGEPRQLFLGNYSSGEVVSYSVDELRNGIRTASPTRIAGTLSSFPNRMAVDKAGTLYASIWGKNYITSWNMSQPLQEHRYYQVIKSSYSKN
ncbi:protein yellow-like [Cloeon dipterum]|uniref:protein yellow-like n=1 Tax=Cloeon dipterum TaxID=197152 RepID=UPI003220A09A